MFFFYIKIHPHVLITFHDHKKIKICRSQSILQLLGF